MKYNKVKSNLGILAVILIICFIFGVGGFYLGARVNNNENNNQDIDENNGNEPKDVENNLSNGSWMDYVLNSDINSIKLSYCVDSASNDVGIPTEKIITITKKELNDIFNEMKKGSIVRNYYGGLGGPCLPSVDVNYAISGNHHELSLILYKFIDPEFMNDQKLLSYLENEKYTIQTYNHDIDLNNEPYMFEYKFDETIIDTIVDRYAK